MWLQTLAQVLCSGIHSRAHVWTVSSHFMGFGRHFGFFVKSSVAMRACQQVCEWVFGQSRF